jgi:glycosyltransferase involved in cell wall biosynthesis
MAMGRAIVASDLDQIGEVIEHGRTGLLVEPEAVEALAAGIRALTGDRDLRTRLGAAARAEALERYTWRAHTARTIRALQDVMHGRG